MADTGVVAGASRADGSIPYELGKPNWEARRIPDIRNPSSSVQLSESRLIDVLILGDGFQTQVEFEEGLQDWIDVFYDLKVYDIFQGAFRIRGLYRESSERASADRDSYYRVKITSDDDEVAEGDWWEDEGDGPEFRRRVFEDVDSFPDINLRRYPSGLSFNESNTDDRDWLFGMYRNLVVAMLVRTNSTSPAEARPRDWIDVVDAFAPLVAALVVAWLGATVTQRFNLAQEKRAKAEREQTTARDEAHRSNQLTLARVEIVERFFPYFFKSEEEKTAALVAIHALGDADLAVRLASLFPSVGSANALEIVATNSQPSERTKLVVALTAMGTESAKEALKRHFRNVVRALVSLKYAYEDSTFSEVECGILVDHKWIVAPQNNAPHVRAEGIHYIERRGDLEKYGDLMAIHVDDESAPPPFEPVQFTQAQLRPGDFVVALGLNTAGDFAEIVTGFVTDAGESRITVRFDRILEHVAGSVLVPTSGEVAGVLERQAGDLGFGNYVSSAEIQRWFAKPETKQLGGKIEKHESY